MTDVYAGDFVVLFVLEEPHRVLTVASQSILLEMIGEGQDGFAEQDEGNDQEERDPGSNCGESDPASHSHTLTCRLR